MADNVILSTLNTLLQEIHKHKLSNRNLLSIFKMAYNCVTSYASKYPFMDIPGTIYYSKLDTNNPKKIEEKVNLGDRVIKNLTIEYPLISSDELIYALDHNNDRHKLWAMKDYLNRYVSVDLSNYDPDTLKKIKSEIKPKSLYVYNTKTFNNFNWSDAILDTQKATTKNLHAFIVKAIQCVEYLILQKSILMHKSIPDFSNDKSFKSLWDIVLMRSIILRNNGQNNVTTLFSSFMTSNPDNLSGSEDTNQLRALLKDVRSTQFFYFKYTQLHYINSQSKLDQNFIHQITVRIKETHLKNDSGILIAGLKYNYRYYKDFDRAVIFLTKLLNEDLNKSSDMYA